MLNWIDYGIILDILGGGNPEGSVEISGFITSTEELDIFFT